jgi:WD40 repeat protein
MEYGPFVRLVDDDGRPEDSPLPPEVVAVLGDRRFAHWHEETKSGGFSPDARFFLTRESPYSRGSPLKLWNPHTGSMVHAFEKCSRGLGADLVSQTSCPYKLLAFTPDGRLLAWLAGSEEAGSPQTEGYRVFALARLWDGRAVRELKWEPGLQEPVELHISPDGSRLAVIGDIEESHDDGLTLLDVRSGLPLLCVGSFYDGPMGFFGFSPDGRFFATSGEGPSAALHDARTGKQLRTFKNCCELAFHPRDATLAWAATDGSVNLAELPGGKLVHTLTGHELGADMLVFDPSGHTLASGILLRVREYEGRVYEGDEEVRLWDTVTGKQTHVLRRRAGQWPGSLESFAAFAFSPDGRRCALVAPGKSVGVWKVASGGKLWEADLSEDVPEVDGKVYRSASLVFTPDSQTLLVGGGFSNGGLFTRVRSVRMWDAATGKERPRFWPDEPLQSVIVSPDGQTLMIEGMYSGVSIWDFTSGKERFPTDGHRAEVTDLGFSPDGKTLASASSDRTVKLWDLSLEEPTSTLIGHTGAVSCIAFSPDGATLATGAWDGTVRFWEVGSGKLLRTVPFGDPVLNTGPSPYDLSFRADGATLAVSLYHGTTALLDPRTGRQRPMPDSPHPLLPPVAFSPDGRIMASILQPAIDVYPFHEPARIELRDAETGSVLHTLADGGRKLCFSHDGRLLAVVNREAVAVWDTASGDQIVAPSSRLPENRAGRGLDIADAAFRPNDSLLALVPDRGELKFMDARTGSFRRKIQLGPSWRFSPHGNCVAFSPDGNLLACSNLGGTILLLDVEQALARKPGLQRPAERSTTAPEDAHRDLGALRK